MVMGSYLSIISLSLNGLNVPIKRQRLAEWIKKTNKRDSNRFGLQETHLKPRDTQSLKVRGWNEISCQWRPKESGVSNTHIR